MKNMKSARRQSFSKTNYFQNRNRLEQNTQNYWMYGLHPVRAALCNPNRIKKEIFLTLNCSTKLHDILQHAQIKQTICKPRYLDNLLGRDTVHQGVALNVEPLLQSDTHDFLAPDKDSIVILLDRVSDPHNVGAVLRSADAFLASAVILPTRHSPIESASLAKVACGAMERIPFIRVRNLAEMMDMLSKTGYVLVGLDEKASLDVGDVIANIGNQPVAFILGSENRGMRESTKSMCNQLARIKCSDGIGSLNVSNAAAISLYAFRHR